jgi:hypothetical protein
MATQLNFDSQGRLPTDPEYDSSQLSSMELYSLKLQKVIADFTEFDAVSRAYVDDKVSQAKQELTDGASSALDTFKELEAYLTNAGVADGLVQQLNALSTSITEEQSRASGEETRIEGLVTAEASRATAAENALQSEVDATQVALGTNALGQYQASQASHYLSTATSFKGADDLLDAQVKANADAVVAEQTRAYNAEQGIVSDINTREGSIRADFATADANERTRAEGEEARIEALVTAEASRATSAENALQTSINNLSSTQNSNNTAQSAESAGILYATFGTDNTIGDELTGYRYVADAGNHFYDGTTGEPVMATHIKNLDESLYYTREAIGSITSSGRLQFSSPLPKYISSNPDQPLLGIARDVIEGFTNINNNFEAEVNSTSTDRANIRSEFAAEDALIQGDLDAHKATQAGVNSTATSDRARIQGELDDEKSRAEGVESKLQSDLTSQVNKQQVDYDKHEGDIQDLHDLPHDGANGGFNIQHDDLNPQDNKYIYFSKRWRLHGSSDGSRLIFEFNKGDDITPNFVSAVPFISHV